MNLLIVDDERHIVNWIHGLLEEHPLEFTVYRAYSAAEALAWMRRTRIDIVITDIRMPRMSGIELMRRIQAEWPRCRIIFLTGYSEFDYVYEAIQSPFVQYLLKTEEDDTILRAVEAAALSLQSADSLAGAREAVDEGALLIESEWVGALCEGPADVGAERGGVRAPFDASKPVYLLLGRVQARGEILEYGARREIRKALNASMKNHLGHAFFIAQGERPDGSYVWLLQPRPDVEGLEPARRIVETLDVIQESVSPFGDLSLMLVEEAVPLAQAGRQIEAVSPRWNALRALDRSVIVTAGATGGDAPLAVPYALSPEEVGARLAYTSSLRTALEDGDESAAAELIGRMMKKAGDVRSIHDMSVMQLYLNIALILYSRIMERGLMQEITFCVGLDRLVNPTLHRTWTEAEAYLAYLARQLILLDREHIQRHQQSVMRTVCDYIDRNLQGDLSLVALAERVHYNPSYLSRAFKRSMGVNLAAYIAGARVERAKELLRTTHLSIANVAAAVGFDNAQYFSTFFKRRFGETPQAYRERNA